MSEASTWTAPCSRCGIVLPLHRLDPVLLDDEGCEASEGLYCLLCFPSVATVPGDVWRMGAPA